jgi:hypothetical protein
MSQISIGLNNPKKGRIQTPTAKKAKNNIKNEESSSSQGSANSHSASIRDSDNNIIKRLKFWQLVQWFMLVTVFVIGITSLLVSVYVIALKQPLQREEMLVTVGIQELRATMNMFHDRLTQVENLVLDLVQELNRSVSELKAALDDSYVTHEIRYQQLNNTILFTAAAVESVRNKNLTNELDLTSGCVQVQSTCIINHNNIGTPSASGVCETDLHDVDVPGFRNVNIYCNIDNSNGETNPVTSTLNIYNGEVSCLCSLVALTEATASPECRLTIQRCPETIRTNIQ